MSDKRFKFECNSLRNADQLRDVGVKDGDTISSRHRRCDADIAASSSNGARIRGAAPSAKHLRRPRRFGSRRRRCCHQEFASAYRLQAKQR